MSTHNSRRNFLKGTAAAGIGYWVAGGVSPKESIAANERLQFGCVGIGGKGSSDSGAAGKAGDVIAICDVDKGRLKGATKRFPKAKTYTDWRELLDKHGKQLNGLTVSTPDHSHFHPTINALNMGIACFTQKPLTHSIWEARQLAEAAAKNKVASQMGNQGTANSNLRKSAAILKTGALGKIKEVHVWTNRPVWAQGGPRPKPSDNVPTTLEWDLWIGPAPFRPYSPGYHPFAWRGWWDFGTGALGDMACHTLNMPFMGLNLRDPVSVQAETSGHNKDSYPKRSKIVYEFPGNDQRGPVTMYWYDGGNMPEESLFGDGLKRSRTGSLIIGEKGQLHSIGDYGGGYKLSSGLKEPEVEYTRSPGHFQEFAEAIKGGPAAVSNFPEYAGPLTETVLLGNLAVWADGLKVEWDAESMTPKNGPEELKKIVHREYRDGYTPA